MTTPIAVAGPFHGVRNVADAPYEDASKYLLSATNGYFRNADGPSSWLARPGFSNPNASSRMGSGQATRGAHSHVDPTTGTIYRFHVVNGILYRSDSSFAVFTNVSPVGIAIDTAVTSRVSFLSVGASLVVTDGVNRPWVMSNFGATPVTGTYIDYNGAGSAWSTWGPPTIYQDSVAFITKTMPGGVNASPRISFVWSEPNQPTIGYEQTGYANYWNMIQTSNDPLYAIWGTNDGLVVWRQSAIEVATGTPSINFSSTASRSALGDAIGTVSPWAIAQFGENIFFLDNRGRPWMLPGLTKPVPLWEQLSTLTTAQNSNLTSPTNLSYTATAAIVPELNQYAAAIWGLISSNPPITASVFDASKGAYAGEWTLHGGSPNIDLMVTMLDADGTRVLYVGTQGYVWILNTINAGVWNDAGGAGSTLSTATTGPIGYQAGMEVTGDLLTIITTNPNTMAAVSGEGSEGSSFSVSNVTPPNPSVTGNRQFRSVVGLPGTASRFLKFTVSGPVNPTTQWGVQRLEVTGSSAFAGPDDT